METFASKKACTVHFDLKYFNRFRVNYRTVYINNIASTCALAIVKTRAFPAAQLQPIFDETTVIEDENVLAPTDGTIHTLIPTP